MERRILKDFQIGFVEGLLNETFKNANDKPAADVFSTIAKAIGSRTSAKKKKPEDWNALVRKNTTVRDPIGNSTEAIMRRSRMSLRKQIIEGSTQGLDMNTDNLVEFNPKLSEVTPVTRVAYVKFMTTKLKKDAGKEDEADAATFENERRGSTTRSSIKKLVELKDKINSIEVEDKTEKKSPVKETEIPLKESATTPAAVTVNPPEETISTAFKEDKDDIRIDMSKVRVRSPIMEDPEDVMSENGDRCPTPRRADSIPKRPETPIPSVSPPLDKKTDSGKPSTTEVSSAGSIKAKESTPSSQGSLRKDTLSPSGSAKSDSSRSCSRSPTPARLEPPPPSSPARTPSPAFSDKGKSKITGKTLKGWM
ncbi:transient receptor potential protein-like isoform X1 [Aedes aegypti]|nr:transient receptor potential protein-like isoform X1 [Aedes aegypti]